jgi:hypothetical protein
MNSDTLTPEIKIKDLTQKAILVSINIGTFSTTKKDKKQSAETASNVGGSTDYIRVNKSLLKNKGTAAVLSFAQKMRLDFYSKTAPWGSDGFRIIKIANYAKIKSELEESKRKFYELVDIAAEEYKDIVNGGFVEEKRSLGSMFNPLDYPSVANFKACFYSKINVEPVKSSDFRSSSLSNEEIAEINVSINERIESSVKTAEFDILSRISDKLNHLSSRLTDFDSKFHTSNVTNVCDTIKEVRELNINDNEGINKILDSIQDKICGMSGESIRDNNLSRANAIIKTKEAISEISTSMADFSF